MQFVERPWLLLQRTVQRVHVYQLRELVWVPDDNADYANSEANFQRGVWLRYRCREHSHLLRIVVGERLLHRRQLQDLHANQLRQVVRSLPHNWCRGDTKPYPVPVPKSNTHSGSERGRPDAHTQTNDASCCRLVPGYPEVRLFLRELGDERLLLQRHLQNVHGHELC